MFLRLLVPLSTITQSWENVRSAATLGLENTSDFVSSDDFEGVEVILEQL